MPGIKRREAGDANRTLTERGKAKVFLGSIPLIHVTSTGNAREIVASRSLETRKCAEFDAELLYFFALKPAYSCRHANRKSDQVGRFPCIFLVDSNKIDPAYHVYPFDTGGALAGVFGDTPNPFVYLEDYELPPSISAIDDHIAWAFGSRLAYYDGDVIESLPDGLAQFDEVARSFIAIARLASSRKNSPDKRSSAIEVAVARNVSLLDHCRAIVIPKQYLEDGSRFNDDFVSRAEGLNITLLTYDWQPNYAPIDFMHQIDRITRTYIESLGALDGR